jgi:hypothetical protein
VRIHIPPAPSSTPTRFPEVVTIVGDATAEAGLIAEKLRTMWRQAFNETKSMHFIIWD